MRLVGATGQKMATAWSLPLTRTRSSSCQPKAGANLRAEFVGRSRAEYAREAAMRGLEGIRKTPSNHPAVMRRLIEVERRLLTADKAFGEQNYGIAVQQFEAISTETARLLTLLHG